jgi:hypothetical protein
LFLRQLSRKGLYLLLLLLLLFVCFSAGTLAHAYALLEFER